jgi:hypothetical protein
VTTELDRSLAIDRVIPLALPPSLGGRLRAAVSGEVTGVAAYGTGWSTFVVLRLPGGVGFRAFRAAEDAGGAAVEIPGGRAVELRASLLTTLLVRSAGGRSTRRTYLVAGLVSPDLLHKAAADLLSVPPGER